MTVSGNRQIRWYQHREHGGSFITSPKNRLPSEATTAIVHAVYAKAQGSAGASLVMGRASLAPREARPAEPHRAGAVDGPEGEASRVGAGTRRRPTPRAARRRRGARRRWGSRRRRR